MKTAGIVLLGGAAVVILYLVSKSGLSGNPFAATASASPSTLTPRLVGYDSTGRAVYAAPTTTPQGPALTGVQSGVVNDTLLAGGFANLAASFLRIFGAPKPTGSYPAGQAPLNLLGEPTTPASVPNLTMSASDMGSPTVADQGITVSGGSAPIYGPFPTTLPGAVYGPPVAPLGSMDSLTGMTAINPVPLSPDLSNNNNPVNYANFGIPDALPPTNTGSGGGSGSYLANDYSGYNVPSTVVDLTAPVDALSLAI
jgi:hypothetical protein